MKKFETGEHMREITNQAFDAERALYGERDLIVTSCRFEGDADGESAFKECKNIIADNCRFALRYPFWHNDDLIIRRCEMHDTCRAALWYCKSIKVSDTKMHGTKALRECCDISIENSDISSQEFGWFCSNIYVRNTEACGEYFMLKSSKLDFDRFTLHGKYSFQYITDSVFENCTFDTKDAFWHAKNVTVRNCTVKGEYLAWYSENITFENCRIIGTQPLCYCKNLRLSGCEMTDCDLAFEKSEVNAVLTKPIDSIKNPLCGEIHVPSCGEIIFDEEWAKGKVIQTNS